MAEWSLALAGNPNAGKSTIFNALTGLRQHTGNWPGKTVEKRSGTCLLGGAPVEVVDLPGTYSLTAYTPEEQVAREFLLTGHPDAVVNVLDATNLERNLYLTVQLLELGVPVVVALNMHDELRKQGARIDLAELSRGLGGAPVVPTSARSGEGIGDLLKAARATEKGKSKKEKAAAPAQSPISNLQSPFRLDYGHDIEGEIAHLEGEIAAQGSDTHGAPPRWLALKLLEEDPEIVARVGAQPGGAAVVALARARAARLREIGGDDVDLLATDRRYGYINGLVRRVLQRPPADRLTLTERIDDVVTHRWLGLPFFLAVMYVVFRMVIDVSAPFLAWMDAAINGPIAAWIGAALDALSAPAWLHSLAIEGIVAGVGGVLVFIPGLLVLYFFLALLEDSGYLARAAFVMDRFMRVVGLHGKSFIPMVLGFGCAVPAIYATRTIASRRDRILTALLVPLMSCSARLPVYVVFGLAFFGARAGTVIWLLYALGIVVALLAGWVFTRTLLRPDNNSAFVLELPPYRRPALRGLLLHMWENTREFIRKAGTLICALAVALWVLLHLPLGVAGPQDSWFGRASSAVAPVLAPLGFGTWEAAGALITGFVAKEVVVSTMSQVYAGSFAAAEAAPPPSLAAGLAEIGSGFAQATAEAARILLSLIPGVALTADDAEPPDSVLSAALQQHFTPLSALAFLVFVLLYVPCIATIGAIRQEFGRNWAITSALYQTGVAWFAAFLVYQGGRLLGLG